MSLLKKEKYLIFYLLSVIVLIPICTYSAWNEDTYSSTVWSILYFFILFFCFYLLNGYSRKTAIWVYWGFTLVPNIVIISFFVMNGEMMKSTDFWVLFDTNIKEASGFMSQFLSAKVLCIVIIYLLSTFFLAFKASSQTEKKTKWYNLLISIFIFFTFSLILPFRTKISSIDFYKSIYNYHKELQEIAKFYENRKNIHYEVSSELNNNVPKTFVIVIGESANRNHYSLYGYPRCTNPELQQIKDELYIYDNVVSPSIQSLAVLKEVLTFANYENPSLFKKDASIIELLKSAGYKTYWIDRQGNGGIDAFTPTSYRKIAALSDVFSVPENEKWDESVIPFLSSVIKDTIRNKVTFIHLTGSHFGYSDKSPKSYKIFDFKQDTIKSLVAEKLREKEKKLLMNMMRLSYIMTMFCIL